jgi:aquaporin Z
MGRSIRDGDASREKAMKKYIVELIGTFFLVLTVGCTVLAGGSGILPPLAIGSALMVMIFAGGHISGGHYNPAVTLGVWMRGRVVARDVVPYLIFQLLGAAIAAAAVKFLTVGSVHAVLTPAIGPALLAEFLFTFALVFVVLNVATSRDTAGNSYFGFAIGFTVMVGAVAVGRISGGAFNPAVAFGITLMGLISWSSIWIYLVADVLGGFAAASAFKLLNPEDR